MKCFKWWIQSFLLNSITMENKKKLLKFIFEYFQLSKTILDYYINCLEKIT